MTRYYVYSIIIHLLVLTIYFYSLTHQDEKRYDAERLKNQAASKDSAEAEIKRRVQKQVETRKRKIDEVTDLVTKYHPTLREKRIEDFADLIVSSRLDEKELETVTDKNITNFSDAVAETDLTALKEELRQYLNESGGQGEEPELMSGAQKNDNGQGSAGTDTDANGNGSGGNQTDGNVKIGGIRYRGHYINGPLGEHTVSTKEDENLTSERLQGLEVNESLNVAEGGYSLPPTRTQKPAQYAILPEPPSENIDTFGQSQAASLPYTLKLGFAPRMNGEFVEDGDLAEWNLSYPMLPHNQRFYSNFTAQVYLSWDLENIYLAAEIRDPNPIIKQAGEWWTSNSLEVWFDMLNSKLHQRFDSGDFQFWFVPYSPYFGKALGSHRFFSRDIPMPVRRTRQGYIVEAAFHQNEELRHYKSILGGTIGFHYFVNTSRKANDGYEQRLFWVTDKYLSRGVHTYTWNNPNSWGDVLLMGSAAKIRLTDPQQEREYRHFGINEWNHILITDGDRNLDTETQQFIKVILHGKYGQDIEELVLPEIGENTGKFSGAIFSEYANPVPGDGLLQISSGEAVEIIYYDQFTPDAHSHLLKQTVHTYYPAMTFSLSL